MKMFEKTKKGGLTALIVAFALSFFGTPAAIAAEDEAGVGKHMNLTIEHTQAALASAKAGDAAGVSEHAKQARQHIKELTGDAAGIHVQRAASKLNTASAAAKKGDTAKAAQALEEALKDLDAAKTVDPSKGGGGLVR